MSKNHPQAFNLPYFRDKESFDLTFGSVDAGTLHTLFDIIKNLAYEIEKRNKWIELYKKEIETLNTYLQLEKEKQNLAKG